MISKDGFGFSFNPQACSSCEARCCRGKSGYIWVDFDEVRAIAEFIKVDIEEFKKDYLRKVGYKYTLKELKINESYDCVFYDKKINGCQIYAVRPKQCRTFPFWEEFKKDVKELKKECPGIL